jgi:hypothetical protein
LQRLLALENPELAALMTWPRYRMSPTKAASGRTPLCSARSAASGTASLAVAVLLLAAPAICAGQDAFRGRDLYLNAAATKGTPMRSCVQCHGLPPDSKLKGASVSQLYGAFASVNEMSGFITAFTLADVTDLSAFLADPSAVPTPLPAIEPLVLRFAAPLAASSPPVTVTLRNDGAAPLRLAADPIGLDGTGAVAFTVAASSCTPKAVLAPAASCQFELRFTPQQMLATAAQMIVRYDSIDRPTSVALSGLPQPRARFTYSIPGLAFAARPLGEPAPAQSVHVFNAGSAPLAVAERRLDGMAATDFGVDGCAAGTVLAPGATCRLEVAFNPSAAGARGATLTLASPDAVEPMTLTLSGEGIAAGARATPAPPVPTPSLPQPPAASTTNAGGGGSLSLAGWLALLVAGALRWRNRNGS